MINLSNEAAAKFKILFNEQNQGINAAIRFAVKGGGCSGFMLDVSVEPARRYEMARKNDIKLISKNIRILVDKKSHLFLDGMTVNYVEQPFGHKFTYDNPNSKGACGCGESFSV